jgi:hypothetical protein
MEVARATGREAAILRRRRIRGTLLRARVARTTDLRNRGGALAHSLCNPCAAALPTRREPSALGALPFRPSATPDDHRRDDARFAFRRLGPGRSAAMHSTAAVRHRPGAANGRAGDTGAVLAGLDWVLDPRAAALALPGSISATMIARAWSIVLWFLSRRTMALNHWPDTSGNHQTYPRGTLLRTRSAAKGIRRFSRCRGGSKKTSGDVRRRE